MLKDGTNQVAASHSKFRSRINIRSADGRPPTGARTVRSILSRPDTDDLDVVAGTPATDDEEEATPDGYQLNALRGSFPESSDDDFELCFSDVDIHSCAMPEASLPLFDSVCGDALPFCIPSDIPPVDSESFLFRRLSETYDPDSRSVFAHADNGSMACTTSDATLLYSYRALSSHNTKVRLFDAGSHSHHPDGVGFLCLPAYRTPSLSLVTSDNAHTFIPCCVFVRTCEAFVTAFIRLCHFPCRDVPVLSMDERVPCICPFTLGKHHDNVILHQEWSVPGLH